jgi:hypothetical protein
MLSCMTVAGALTGASDLGDDVGGRYRALETMLEEAIRIDDEGGG